jgi:nitroimidazol reductase NimA-like FMN-containing flavoprotein (pyridoxamine 5'-phosphate oxidase superfamily)
MEMEELIMSPEEIDEFLAEPITGQLATNGPTIRPMWYQWEDGAFWIISGPWAKLLGRVQKDPEVALCIDVGDFESGQVKQVCVYGAVEIRDYDVELVRRMLHRYLGPDEESWSDSPDDYRGYLKEGGPGGGVLLRLVPRKMTALNFTYARVRSGA